MEDRQTGLEDRLTGLAEHRPIQVRAEHCRSPEHRRRSLDGTSPHSNRCRVAFPTLRPPRLRLFGSGAVDEAWKTHDRCRSGRGRGRSRTACPATSSEADPGATREPTPSRPTLADGRSGPSRRRPGPEHRPIQSSGRALPRCGGPVARSGGTSPHSNRGRVAFPTLRPLRLRLFGGPAPWTKRGKRTTDVALVGAGSAAGPRQVTSSEADPGATREPTPSRSMARRWRGYPRFVHGDDPQSIKSRWAKGG